MTQAWRVVSEHLRADWRGGGCLTAYQWMSLATLVLVAGLLPWISAETNPQHSFAKGIATLWSPGVLLLLQALWVVLFVYTGSSRNTAVATKSAVSITIALWIF